MNGRFNTTQWSLVRAGGDSADPALRREALEVLCGTYWSPVYDYVRCRGYGAESARDLTQAPPRVDLSIAGGSLSNVLLESAVADNGDVVAFATLDPQEPGVYELAASDPDTDLLVQDRVVAAVNEAIEAAQKEAAEKTGEITGGLNIPGLPGLG